MSLSSPGSALTVTLESDEIAPLREAMGDLQRAVADYYSATGAGRSLGPYVRAFLVASQTLNDLLTEQVKDKATYKSLFTTARHTSASLVEAAKFARNVTQHVLHIVRPSDDLALVGGDLGFRIYAKWDAVPPQAVAKLHKGTRSLEPYFRSELEDKEVTGTMMRVLRFFAEIAPPIVARDARGEWIGFPLHSQPGVTSPLHPEEPLDPAAARTWLDSRRPGGSCRVVVGQTTLEGVPYVYGHTFEGRLSFAPFIETVAQANFDITLDFPYLEGDLATNLEDVTDRFPEFHQGTVLQSRGEVLSWATPLPVIPSRDDWNAPSMDAEAWSQLVRLEADQALSFFTFNARRARRLNALGPTR